MGCPHLQQPTRTTARPTSYSCTSHTRRRLELTFSRGMGCPHLQHTTRTTARPTSYSCTSHTRRRLELTFSRGMGCPIFNSRLVPRLACRHTPAPLIHAAASSLASVGARGVPIFNSRLVPRLACRHTPTSLEHRRNEVPFSRGMGCPHLQQTRAWQTCC